MVRHATKAKKQEPAMGRFSVEVEFTNADDLALVRSGHLPPEKVRRVKMRGVVDPGATRLVLPKSVVKMLGLPTSGTINVRYADGRMAVRDLVDNVHLTLLGRSSVFKASVEPRCESALIGAIVLEDLDFLVDSTLQQLRPRDPKMIVSEAE
jgi:predicted aspartyl protease